jgi:hypothetical protein
MDTLESDHAMDGQSSTPEHEHRTQAPESSENKNTHCMMHYSEPRVLNVQRSTMVMPAKKFVGIKSMQRILSCLRVPTGHL